MGACTERSGGVVAPQGQNTPREDGGIFSSVDRRWVSKIGFFPVYAGGAWRACVCLPHPCGACGRGVGVRHVPQRLPRCAVRRARTCAGWHLKKVDFKNDTFFFCEDEMFNRSVDGRPVSRRTICSRSDRCKCRIAGRNGPFSPGKSRKSACSVSSFRHL